MIWIFERRQRVRISAPSYDLALREAEHDDCPWDIGEVELIDRKDDDAEHHS